MKNIPKQDVSIFQSKSNVLKYLKNRITDSYIEKIFDFTVKDWNLNQEKFLSEIQSNFPKQKIIVRSSAMGEDSEENSQAGSYESILNINSNSKWLVRVRFYE